MTLGGYTASLPLGYRHNPTIPRLLHSALGVVTDHCSSLESVARSYYDLPSLVLGAARACRGGFKSLDSESTPSPGPSSFSCQCSESHVTASGSDSESLAACVLPA
eukprot:2847494-Rhodomonas_salina.1